MLGLVDEDEDFFELVGRISIEVMKDCTFLKAKNPMKVGQEVYEATQAMDVMPSVVPRPSRKNKKKGTL